MEKLLDKLYKTPKNPASLGGLNRLLRAAQDYDISKKEVISYLKNQDGYSLHKDRRVNYKTSKTYSFTKNNIWMVDLSSLVHIAEENDNVKYLLFCIDVYSRYLWVKPLKTKYSAEVADKFIEIFNDGHIPAYICADEGSEFKGNTLQLFKTFNIGFYNVYGKAKASLVERVQRTIKSRIFRYLTIKNSKRYIDELNNIVESYNITPHSSTKLTPKQKYLYNTVYEYPLFEKCQSKPKFKVGEHVRVSRILKEIQKSFEGTFSYQIFVIDKIVCRSGLHVYRLKDLNNDTILGIFYEQELQSVNYDKNAPFRIEKILHTKKIGNKTLFKVRFLGYGPQFDTYVEEAQLVKKDG